MNPVIWFLSMLLLGLATMDASAPWYGLAGEKCVNVFELNLEVRKWHGML